MTDPRRIFGLVPDADWPDENWALAGLLGLFFLGIVGLYAFSGDHHPVTAAAVVDETTGQGPGPVPSAIPTLR